MSSVLDRAKAAFNVHSDKDFANKLGVAPTTIVGYKNRNGSVPLEQLIKVSEQSGVSLDWLVLGKEKVTRIPPDAAEAAKFLPVEQQMLLTGWTNLDKAQQDYIFALLFQIARGDKGVWPPRENDAPLPQVSQVVHGDVGQQSSGDVQINELNFNSNKK